VLPINNAISSARHQIHNIYEIYEQPQAYGNQQDISRVSDVSAANKEKSISFGLTNGNADKSKDKTEVSFQKSNLISPQTN